MVEICEYKDIDMQQNINEIQTLLIVLTIECVNGKARQKVNKTTNIFNINKHICHKFSIFKRNILVLN
jgi:hypothetical protein